MDNDNIFFANNFIFKIKFPIGGFYTGPVAYYWLHKILPHITREFLPSFIHSLKHLSSTKLALLDLIID